MEPTQPTPLAPAATPPSIGEPIVEFVRVQRHNAGMILGTLAVVFLGVGVFLAYKAFRTSPPAADKPDAAEKADDPKSRPVNKSPEELVNLRQWDFTVGWVACLLAFLVTSGGSLYLIAAPPKPGEAQQRSEARQVILYVGQALGIVLILAGLRLFYGWSESLTKWLDTSDTTELRWVLIPVLMIVLGAGLVFAAIQPARAEERDNATVRRVVYGSNFGLTVLLLVVAFVVFNVLVAVKVPNKLDATETGQYELSEQTKQFLGKLEEPVTAYAILPEGGAGNDPTMRLVNDIRELLFAFRDNSGGKFRAKFLSPVANRKELAELRDKFKMLDLTLKREDVGGAILLTTGAEEQRQAIIRDSEFLASGEEVAFQGEAKLFQEVAFLADNQSRPVVYFTQSNRELSITEGAGTPQDRSASKLKAYLEKNYLTVKPLTLSEQNPVVPEDASVVVVADPQIPFSQAVAGAISKYVATPQKDGKKGKLVVLAGANPGPDGKVTPTGLEGVLGELGVRLGDQFVFNLPNEVSPNPRVVLAAFNPTESAARNPVIAAMSQSTGMFGLPTPREVLPAQGNPSLEVEILLASFGITWVEDEFPANVSDAARLVRTNQEVADRKQLTKSNRPLGVVVSERAPPRAGGADKAEGRAVVIGNALVSDAAAPGRSGSSPFSFSLIGVSIDWLRGRPPIAATGIAAKKYREYQFPPPAKVDSTRLEYLPIGLAFLGIVGLGAGVWVVRRR